MFRAVKNPLEVEVSLVGEKVKVKPVVKNPEKGMLCRTLARCEEFLAQVFMQEQSNEINVTKLVHFFKQRGWYIMEA